MLTAGAALKLLLCAAQLKLATVGFTQVGMTDAQAGFFAEHFSVQLASIDENVRVTTPKDMADVLGVEKQRQLLGCAENASSCMAELAGALGADGLVTGQIAKVGKSYQLNVKILAADGSKNLFLHSSKLLESEEALIGELNAVAARAITRLRTPAGAAVPETEVGQEGGRRSSKLKLLPAAGGIVIAGLGGVVFGFAMRAYGTVTDHNNDYGMVEAAVKDGKTNVTVGTILVSVGLAAILAGVLWYLLS